MVVHDVGQMVGRQLVGRLIEHLIIQHGGVNHYLTTNQIVYMHLLVRLDTEANHILLALGNQRLYLLAWHYQRVAHLQACGGIILEVGHLGTLGFQLLGRIECDIGPAVVKQLLHVLLIDVATLRLTVRTVVATKAHSFVERDAEPLE